VRLPAYGITLRSWADTVRDEGILTSRKILAYHPVRQSIEKRLARHLASLLETSSHATGVATRRIADIYDELRLTVEEVNPGRTQARFERALEQIRCDGISLPGRMIRIFAPDRSHRVAFSPIGSRATC